MDAQNPPSIFLSKAKIITVASLILGLLFDYFFYGKIPGLSFPLYVILIVAGLFAIAFFLKKRIATQAIWLMAPLVFFSAMVFVRESMPLTFLNILAALLLMLAIAKISFEGKIKSFWADDYIKIIFLPLSFIRPLLKTLSCLFLLNQINKDRRALAQVARGLVMAIPILFVFLLLFSSADLIFQKYLSNLIDIQIAPETFSRLFLILIAVLAYIGAYSYIFGEEKNITALRQENKYKIGRIEIFTVLGLVNALFLIFILIQLAYLFGGQNNISAQGFTYASYARRGFFELIAVAFISLILLLAVDKYVSKKETKHAPGFKILSGALIILVIAIMASAFLRLSLYEQAYGFTALRLYSHAFIIFLAAVFGLLLYKISRDNQENTFVFRVFILMIMFLAAINFLNPDSFIARQNIKHFAENKKLDINYLSQLSDDAMSQIIEVLNISDGDQKNELGHKLYWRSKNRATSLYSKWQSLNISRLNAKKILDSKIPELELYKDYQPRNSDSAAPQ